MRFEVVKIFIFWLFCCSGSGALAAVSKQSSGTALPGDYPEKILFVGNSFTYYNNGLHKHYGDLLRAANLHEAGRNELRMMTYSGSGLWEHPAALRSALINDPWDAVVMHDYSNGPIVQWKRFVSASDALSDIARSYGAVPILMMTWAYAGRSEMTAELAKAYSDRGKALGAKVIPVGLAFAAAAESLAVDLYSADLLRFEAGVPVFDDTVKHPSVAGTYLAACTVYAALTGRNPEGLIYHGGLDPKVARDLQRVAFQTVRSYEHEQ